jgi:hypothetical protein
MADSLISTGEGNQTDDEVLDAAPASEAPARPEWLPEKFWVNGQPAYDQLAKSYGEIETAFRSKEDVLRERLIDELSAEALNARPEAPEKYELPEVQGIDVTDLAGHPMTEWWSKFSFENGFDQDTFKQGIEMYLSARMSDFPNAEEEMKLLGDNASARTEAVGLWVGQSFEPEERQVIESLCTTAAGVKVVERIMKMVRGEGDETALLPSMGETVTETDVQKMMQDRRYWSPTDRDPAYIKKVESFFQKKYGAGA